METTTRDEDERTLLRGVGLRVTRIRDWNGAAWYLRNGEITKVGNVTQGWTTSFTDIKVHALEDPNQVIRVIRKVLDDLEADFEGTLLDKPLVLGVGAAGAHENFLASDQLALRQVTDRFMYLEEGDIAEIRRDGVQIWDTAGNPVQREAVQYHEGAEAADKGEYRHFMLKEIHEQPKVVQRTLEGRLGSDHVLVQAFGPQAAEMFAKVKNVQIVACGTSYHAGMVARYWLEALTGIPCQIEVASEFRYRKVVVQPDTLFVSVSQSGETADTLAALRNAKEDRKSVV